MAGDARTTENIVVERRDRVGLIRLDRPMILTALSVSYCVELNAALDDLAADDDIGAIVLTGSDHAFSDLLHDAADHAGRAHITTIGKPVIAAVAGSVLGGGCELAMMCDFLLAADTARFGPRPGAGGRQGLTWFAGTSTTMEMGWPDRLMDAAEAERVGLVSRVIPAADLIEEAVKVAQMIAGMCPSVIITLKEATNRARETPPADGLRSDCPSFYAPCAVDDQPEGMPAVAGTRQSKIQNH